MVTLPKNGTCKEMTNKFGCDNTQDAINPYDIRTLRPSKEKKPFSSMSNLILLEVASFP